MSYSRDNVETHYGSDRPAVNVKVYGSMSDAWPQWRKDNPEADERFTAEWVEDTQSDERIDNLFWDVCGFEFEMIEQDAQEILGNHVEVFSDGRSGGWAVVQGLDDIGDWDAIALARWRKFERYAKETARFVPYQMIGSLYMNEFEIWTEEESERLGSEAFAAVGGMIPRRYAWLLRDESVMFEGVGHWHGACKLCAALERSQTWMHKQNQARHLAAHRAEKITNDPDPALAMIAAQEEE